MRQSGSCQLYRIQDVFRDTYRLALRPSHRVLARDGGREWFEQYCRKVVSVPRHPNVLMCERMTHDGELPFLVAEDVEGRGWDSAIIDAQLTELRRMLDVAWQVAEGLAWLHTHGQIHYNVKPANVLIANSGIVKVWKYGEAEGRTRAFGSPEQIAGNRELTPATDVWSWAVSVLNMFVGKVAWPSGAKAPLALRRYMRSGPAMRGVALMPGTLAELLSTCFHTNPEARPENMEQVAEGLKGILVSLNPGAAGPPPSAPQPGTPAPDQNETDTDLEQERGQGPGN
ncbi:MAG: protein kinase domain-containing protein [Planctomycetota bacterium]|jgi:serine/threonine protein kinase